MAPYSADSSVFAKSGQLTVPLAQEVCAKLELAIVTRACWWDTDAVCVPGWQSFDTID